MPSDLLLHVCCGPCVIYPIDFLKQKDFSITAFFYNPNIHPKREYKKRLKSTKKYLTKESIILIIPPYSPEEYHSNVKERCIDCWKLRLKKTATYAAKNGFNYFTSTLLISPHQDIQKIKQIGQELADKYQIKFFDPGQKGFRPGFVDSRKQAKKEKMYAQNYCGCIHSKLEREQEI